jgi:hypothetical protein
MITEALIKNFKCFKQLTLPDLGRITLIGGRNNVGKTALLEALFLFFDRTPPNMILKQYGWRGLANVITTPEGMWAPIFREYDLAQQISISVSIDGNEESATYKYNPNFTLEVLPPNEIPHDSEGKTVRTDLEPTPSFSLDVEFDDGSKTEKNSHLIISPKGAPGIKHDYAATGLRPAIFLPAKVQLSSKETCDRFSKLTKTGREPDVLKFLKLIEPRLKNIAVITEGPEPVIYGDIGLPEMIPISFMGGGMVRLLDIILAIAWCENAVVFVDEVENGIHRLLLPKIWEAIGNAAEDYNCQVIATTHSYECLEAVHKGLANSPDDLRYIRLDRERNVIIAKTSNYEMLGSAIAHNMEIRS